jgi:hypothetical protein
VATKTMSRPSVSTDTPAPAVAPLVPVKVRRRPAFIVGSVAALLVGGLAGVWLWTSATSTVEVVAARNTVTRGAAITAADLMTVRIGVDPAIRALPAGQLSGLVGRRAALDIAAGGVVTPADVTDVIVPAKGMTMVGLSLPAGALPSIALVPGDRVRIVQTPTSTGPSAQVPVTVDAQVVTATRTKDAQATLVDVLVAAEAAPDLASRSATGKVQLVLDTRER